jgi:hypothetical protein
MATSSQKPQIAQPVADTRPPLPLWILGMPEVRVFLLYTLLSVILTFPLVFQMGTHIRGGGATGDAFQNVWYMWWYGRALEQGLDPSRTNLMYGLLPDVQVLISSVLNGLLMYPVIKLFGVVFAYNFAVLISFPLAGYFTYKLAGSVLAERGQFSRPPAFAAGFFFTFTTYHFYRLDGHLGLVTIQWLPFYLWRLWELGKKPGWLNAIWAGVGFAFAALSDLYYLGYWVVPVTLVWLVWQILARRKDFLQRTYLKFYAVAAGLGVALTAPFYLFFLNLDADIRQAVTATSNDTVSLSADLVSWFAPVPVNPLFGTLTSPLYGGMKTIFPIEQGIFPGYVLLALGVAALFIPAVRRATWFWLTLGGVGFILSLGPKLVIAGWETPLPLPYWLVGKLPFFASFRAPNRLSLLVILALAVLAALVLVWLGQKLKLEAARANWLLAGALALNVLTTLTFMPPMQTYSAQIPAVYKLIAAEPGDYLVLELPFANRSNTLYYQTFHQKRLVGGIATRISNRMTLSWDKAGYLGMFNTAESSEVINNGKILQAPGGVEIFPLDVSFKDTLLANNIRFVIFRTDRRAFSWIQDYLLKELGTPNFQETADGESLAVWRFGLNELKPLPPVAPDNYRVHLGDGWNAGLGFAETGHVRRFVEQNGQLQITAGSAGSATLRLKVTPAIRPQTIEIRLNGQLVGTIPNAAQWKIQDASFNLNLSAGQNLIELRSQEGCLIAGDYIPNSPDRRCISFAVQEVSLTKG